VLPESIGDLTIGGHLYLGCNKLESLPESFGSLAVGGTVCMIGNPVSGGVPSREQNSFPGLTLELSFIGDY